MDPRHPENAIWRMRQLMEQFQFVLNKLNAETVSSKLGEAEREGALVVQEICLVAPRLHEAMMQASRQRRHDLTRGVVEKPVENPYGEIAVHDAKPEEYIEKPVEEDVKKTDEKVDIHKEDVNEKPKKKRKPAKKKKAE